MEGTITVKMRMCLAEGAAERRFAVWTVLTSRTKKMNEAGASSELEIGMEMGGGRTADCSSYY